MDVSQPINDFYNLLGDEMEKRIIVCDFPDCKNEYDKPFYFHYKGEISVCLVGGQKGTVKVIDRLDLCRDHQMGAIKHIYENYVIKETK